MGTTWQRCATELLHDVRALRSFRQGDVAGRMKHEAF